MIGAFLLTVSLVMIVGYFYLQSIRSVHGVFADIVDNRFPQLVAVQNMRALAFQLGYQALLYQQSNGTDSEVQKSQLLASTNDLTAQENAYLILVNRSDEAERTDILSEFKPVSAAKSQTVTAVLDLIALKAKHAAPALINAKQLELTKAEFTLERTLGITIDQNRSSVENQDGIADQEVQRSITTAYVLTGLAASFGLLLGSTIAYSFIRRLKKLQEGAVRIASGDFSGKLTDQSHDEIGQLATAFNEMSVRLKDSYRRLEVERLRDEAILQSMSEGLIAIDEKTNIVLINNRATELLELPKREKLGGVPVNHVFTIYDDQDKPLPAAQTPAIVTLQTRGAVSGVYGFHKKNATKILVNVEASPVIANKVVAGAIMTLRDVTKEREVDRMKTEFISLASHQLRTPLSAIKWFDEMLISGDAGVLQPEQLDFAKNIADSTERMIALVNALLNISRIESGRIMVDPKPTDLRELVSGIINDLKAKTEEKQQTLVISVHEELPKINLDPRLIGQVYLNLLTNAVKYTPKGGEISVFISKKDDQIISQVTDNGYGIPRDQQDRVFQKFFRAANAVKVETDGTGLGLYLIKAVIESSGGKIWFESEEGKGTSFWFSIPLSGMIPKQGEVTLDV